MARIAGVDLPRNKRIEIALTYIYGIGRTSAPRDLREGRASTLDTQDGSALRRRGGAAARDHRARLQGRGRSAPRGVAEHQDADGHRLLPRAAPPPRAAGARTAHAHQRAHPQGSGARRSPARRRPRSRSSQQGKAGKREEGRQEEGQEERRSRASRTSRRRSTTRSSRSPTWPATRSAGRRPARTASRARASRRPSRRRSRRRSARRRRWSTASASSRVFVKGPGAGRESAVRALQAAGIKVIDDPGRDADPAQRLPPAEAAPRLGNGENAWLATPMRSVACAGARARSSS